MIKVLLADDQPLVRTGFQMILDAEPDIEVIGEAGDGADAVRQCRKLGPDVVVMDIRMPVQDGIAATAEIAAEGLALVLVLTTFQLDEYVIAALRAGASGFLLKDVDAAKLAEAIRVIAGGNAIVDPTVTRRLLDHFTRAVRDPAKARRPHRTRNRGPDTGRARPVQRRDRGRTRGHRDHREDPCAPPAGQDRRAGPGATRDLRV
jgi:DNA-binding NarL/FixJ family response regulator